MADQDRANSGIRREPGLPDHEAVAPEEPKPALEPDGLPDDPDAETIAGREMTRKFCDTARRAALDRGDGLDM